MAILVTCRCGQELRVKEHLSDKKVRCPQCEQPVAVPVIPAAVVVTPAEVVAAKPARRSAPAATPRRKKRSSAARPKGVPVAVYVLGGVLGLAVVVVIGFLAVRPASPVRTDNEAIAQNSGTIPELAPAPSSVPEPSVGEPETPAPTESATTAIAAKPVAVGPDFDLDAWVQAVAQVDHATWNKHHPTPYSGSAGFGWYDDNDDTSAQRYIITWGRSAFVPGCTTTPGGDSRPFAMPGLPAWWTLRANCSWTVLKFST